MRFPSFFSKLTFCVAASLLTFAPLSRAAETSPWNLEKLYVAPKFEWVAQNVPIHSLMYTGDTFQGKPSKVFAYYASPETLGKPRKDGERYPAVVLIHGGGGTAFKAWAQVWAKRGYAAIAMDLSGKRPDEVDTKITTPIADGGPDQGHPWKFDTIKTEDISDDWCYHAVANSILAHSLLRSFPEIDVNRTAVTGISWGGYTTCIVASLDTRFKAAVPVYGCGFLDQNSTWLGEFTRLGAENTKRWVKMYDPGTWLPQCKVPIFFVNGTNDFAYPIDSYMKSYDAVKSPKNIRIEVKMPHGHGVGWERPEIGLFVDHALGLPDAKALAQVETPVLENDKVTAKVSSVVPIKSANLIYAKTSGPINKREWETVPANVVDGVIVAPSPPAESETFYVNVIDERNAMVSSPVVFREVKVPFPVAEPSAKK